MDNAVLDLLQQFLSANNYVFFEDSKDKFLVKKLHWESFNEEDPVTRFERTRVVERHPRIRQKGGDVLLPVLQEEGAPMQALLLCVLGRGPMATDCDVK
jgi:hypothetical protein